MNKHAAENIAQEHYNMGLGLAFEKVAKVDLSKIEEAMDAQDALLRGSVEDRIGTAIEQRRREGALSGTAGGGIVGALLGAGIGRKRGKALALLGALLGGGTGAVGGNLLGRATGMAAGGLQGGLSALPGVRQTTDLLTRPLDEY